MLNGLSYVRLHYDMKKKTFNKNTGHYSKLDNKTATVGHNYLTSKTRFYFKYLLLVYLLLVKIANFFTKLVTLASMSFQASLKLIC